MRTAAAGLDHGAGERTGDVPFVALAREAHRAGLHILAPKAPFLTDDEVKLIGWIACRQRDWAAGTMLAPDGLDAATEACAVSLKASNLRLSPLSV